jgi:hypothetical protein
LDDSQKYSANYLLLQQKYSQISCDTGKSYIERAIQQLCPMELSCDITKGQEEQAESLNPRAREFTPKRAAAVTANERIKDMLNEESTVE